MRQSIISYAIAASTLFSTLALAQAPQAAPPRYTGSFGGGVALTGGNTDTTNFNLTFALVLVPKTKNVIKANALYLRGEQNKVVNLDRAAINIRDEYSLSKRAFLYGQMDYIRDKFKEIDYLFGPSAGIGYKLVDSDATKLAVDVGSGGLWEKNTDLPVKKSGSLTAGERLSRTLSATSTFTQSVATLWKMNDFSDSLTNAAIGLTTSITQRLQLKVELQDSFKNKPPSAEIKKNDTAFLTTFVVKF